MKNWSRNGIKWMDSGTILMKTDVPILIREPMKLREKYTALIRKERCLQRTVGYRLEESGDIGLQKQSTIKMTG